MLTTRYNPAMKIYLPRKRLKYCDCGRRKQNLYPWQILALKMIVKTTVMQNPHLRTFWSKEKHQNLLQKKGPQDEIGTTFEKVDKDLNALTMEEQMDVVYGAAPELVGLLTELNDASEQLENIINPLLTKARKGNIAKKGRLKYLELKRVLLLSYCQAITFYLLLKYEGQPVRDHPVIERLVEIKSLLE